jgi:hypothetical protein
MNTLIPGAYTPIRWSTTEWGNGAWQHQIWINKRVFWVFTNRPDDVLVIRTPA